MKYLIILISIFLFAKEPAWIKNNFPKDGASYFVGVSTYYLTDDALVEEKAKEDALNDAYKQISAYFWVKVNSELNIIKKSNNNNAYTKIQEKIKTKTFHILFNLKPYKTYKKYTEDGKYFQMYVLIRLDKKTEQKIKAKQKKEIKEFKNLENKIIQKINNAQFFEARNLLTIAKHKSIAYMYEDELKAIEQRLNDILNNSIKATIILNKKVYLPNESINAQIIPNKKCFLYVLYDTGNDIEMVFPNEYVFNNYVKEPIIFPNDDIDIQAYEDSISKKPSIIAIASKKRLILKRDKDDVIDGIYIFNNWNKIKPIIDKCKKEAQCFITKQTFEVKSFIKPKYQLILKTNPSLKKQILNFLSSKGIKNNQSKNKIYVTITQNKKYSKFLDDYIDIFNIKIVKNNQTITKTTSDENELYNIILNTMKE